MNKLIIIDDDKALTELLSDYLESQSYMVEVYNNPLRGIDALSQQDFDALLLDVMMPDLDGFECLKKIRQFSVVPVIMLTAKGDDYDKILGLELGADDYLAKPFNQRELLARIKALIRRQQINDIKESPQHISIHNIFANELDHSVHVNEQSLDVTATEFALLLSLMASPGQLRSKEYLSEKVLGRRLSAFDRSLDMHISNIRKKLSAHGVQNVIKTVRGSGYLMQREAK